RRRRRGQRRRLTARSLVIEALVDDLAVLPPPHGDLRHGHAADALEADLHRPLRERYVAVGGRGEHGAAVPGLDAGEELLLALAVQVLAAELRVGVLLHDDGVVVQLLERLHGLAGQDRVVQLLVELGDVAHADGSTGPAGPEQAAALGLIVPRIRARPACGLCGARSPRRR